MASDDDDNRKPPSALIDQAIGHLGDVDSSVARHNGALIDWVDITWMQCARRALRLKSRGGRDLKILLRLGQRLGHGDVVWRSFDSSELIAINVLPIEVISVRTADFRRLALLAFELGNLHVAIEVTADELLAPADGPVMEAFEKAGIDFRTCSQRFTPTALGTPGGTIDSPGVSISSGFRIERK